MKRFILMISLFLMIGLIYTPLVNISNADNLSKESIVDYSSGRYHTLILKNDGTVWAWGSNSGGQLGDPTYYNTTSPVQVKGLSGVMAVSAGEDFHSVVLKKDGTVWSWGSNYYGEVGNGTKTPQDTPTQTKGISKVIAISAGASYTLALKKDGTVWEWGFNFADKYTDGPRSDKTTPQQVKGLNDVMAISAGSYFAMALKRDGTVWTWGQNSSGQLGIGTLEDHYSPIQIPGLDHVVSISAGSNFAVALKDDGTVWTWGENSLGQLGDQTNVLKSSPIQVPGLDNVKAVSARGNHTIALKKDGTVWIWGSDRTDQTGIQQNQPVQVEKITDASKVIAGVKDFQITKNDQTSWLLETTYFSDEEITSISAGGDSSIALGKDGSIWSWGFYDYSVAEIDLPLPFLEKNSIFRSVTNRPSKVIDLENVKAVSPNTTTEEDDRNNIHYKFFLALKKDGMVWAWGGNDHGQLGNGNTKMDFKNENSIFSGSQPVQVKNLNDIIAVTAGRSHALALKKDGTVWAWGSNQYGQLGQESTENQTIAKKVNGLSNVKAVSASENYSLALKKDGTVWAWGDNGSGQLGDGTNKKKNKPVQVKNLTDIISIQAGANHALALKKDGTVWSWGNNQSGQLGDGKQENKNIPVKVKGLSNVIYVSAGEDISFAVKKDGTLWAWGKGNIANPGSRTGKNVMTPARIGISDVTQVSAGKEHVLILTKGGSVYAWGSNSYGQVGIGNGKEKFVAFPIEINIPIKMNGKSVLTLKRIK